VHTALTVAGSAVIFPSMKTALIAQLALLLVGLVTASAQGHKATRPAILDSTYEVPAYVSPPYQYAKTVHLYEDGRRLRWDEKLTPKEKERASAKDAKGTVSSYALMNDGLSYSLDYDTVTFVEYSRPALAKMEPPKLQIETSSSRRIYYLPLPVDEDGQRLAEYVARKSSMGLKLIGRAWRIRKPFQCPQDGKLGCRDFKDLLDHGDPDIADYFYSHDEDTHHYACFRDQGSFFILNYSHIGEFGTFFFEDFKDQQAGGGDPEFIRWSGDFGRIEDSQPAQLGTIDDSTLYYETKFQNKEKTTTEYSLSVRWSTGRFTENYSWKDKKGEAMDFDQKGVCVKLN
jgi:hypothetical protein